MGIFKVICVVVSFVLLNSSFTLTADIVFTVFFVFFTLGILLE